MSWLFPGFLAGLLAVALPLVLHLLRKRAKVPVVFPSLRFLAASPPQNAARHRLRRRIVLALRCLALALLALAFARPFFSKGGSRGGRAVVVVLDNSFSLQATTRWADTLRWAVTQIGRLETGDRLGVLLMAPRPTWLVAPTTDTQAALRALETSAPGWESAHADPALRLAAEVLAATPAREREIVFGGDHQRVSWLGTDFSRPLAAGVSVSFPPLPASLQKQAALLAPSLEREGAGLRARITIRNFGDSHSRRLRVHRAGESAAAVEQTLDLAGHETRTLDVDLPAPVAGAAAFRFTLDADDLPADDSAYTVWRGAGGRRLLLDAPPPGSAADFAATAFQSTADLKPALQVTPPPAGAWPADAVAVLRNDASFAGATATRLDAFLQAGGAALVFIGGGTAQRQWLTMHGIVPRAMEPGDEDLRVHNWTLDHPLVTALSENTVRLLVGWSFRHGWGLAADTVHPLALWTQDAVAIGETYVGPGRLLVCGFTPDRRASEWPVQGAFVPFVHRAAAYLFNASESGETAPARVGTSLVLPPSSGSWRAVDGPASSRPATVVSGSVVPDAPGLYELTIGAERQLFPVHLSPDESDPAAWEPGTPWVDLVSTRAAAKGVAAQAPLAALEAEQQGRLWWWLLGVAVLALALELPVANRTSR
jgi:hypothetical protein